MRWIVLNLQQAVLTSLVFFARYTKKHRKGSSWIILLNKAFVLHTFFLAHLCTAKFCGAMRCCFSNLFYMFLFYSNSVYIYIYNYIYICVYTYLIFIFVLGILGLAATWRQPLGDVVLVSMQSCSTMGTLKLDRQPSRGFFLAVSCLWMSVQYTWCCWSGMLPTVVWHRYAFLIVFDGCRLWDSRV